jgi:hypothetical protein
MAKTKTRKEAGSPVICSVLAGRLEGQKCPAHCGISVPNRAPVQMVKAQAAMKREVKMAARRSAAIAEVDARVRRAGAEMFRTA